MILPSQLARARNRTNLFPMRKLHQKVNPHCFQTMPSSGMKRSVPVLPACMTGSMKPCGSTDTRNREGPRFKSGRPDQIFTYVSGRSSGHSIRLGEDKSTSTASVENKQTQVQGSHVVPAKKVGSARPARSISSVRPGKGAQGRVRPSGYEVKAMCGRIVLKGAEFRASL